MTTLLQMLYLLLPAIVANMVPVFVRDIKLPSFLEKPIDGGLRFMGKPLLGAHKTWKGLIAGIIAASIVTAVQAMLAPTIFDSVNYRAVWLPLGVALGAGALVGDAVKSFFKRRTGVPSGSPWFPYDQIDFGIGAVVAAAFFAPVQWPVAFASVSILGAGHIVIVFIGHALGLRKELW